MHLMRALLAGAAAGIGGVMASWLFTGVIFHPYQRLTPSTWRPEEGSREYALSSALTIFAAVVVALFFALTGGVPVMAGLGWLVNGAAFGLLCWAALALPVLLSVALFVNLHALVVVGLLLDWLVVSLLAGVAAAWAVG